jgi:hypothetical protein
MLQLYIDEVIWNEWCNHPHFGVWLVFKSRAIHGYTMQRKDNLQIIISSMLTIRPYDLVETSNIPNIHHQKGGVLRCVLRDLNLPAVQEVVQPTRASNDAVNALAIFVDLFPLGCTSIHWDLGHRDGARWHEVKQGEKNGAWSITEGPKKPNKPNKLNDTCDTWIPFKSF